MTVSPQTLLPIVLFDNSLSENCLHRIYNPMSYSADTFAAMGWQGHPTPQRSAVTAAGTTYLDAYHERRHTPVRGMQENSGINICDTIEERGEK